MAVKEFWLGGGGEKVTLKLVAKWADGCNIGGGDPDVIRQKLDVLRGHCETLGRDINEIAISTNLDIHLLADGEDPAKAADWTGGMLGSEQYQRQFKVGNADQITAKIQAAVDAGANYINVYMPQLAYNQDMLRRYAETVIPRFA